MQPRRRSLKTVPRIQATTSFLDAVRVDKLPMWQIAITAGFRYPQLLSALLYGTQPKTDLIVGRFHRVAEVIRFTDKPFEEVNTTEEISIDNGVDSARSMTCAGRDR